MASFAASMHPVPLPDQPSTILVVDHDERALAAYQQHLSSHARLLAASSGEGAEDLARRELAAGGQIHAAFVHVQLPGVVGGLETLRRLLALDPEVMCVVVGADPDQSPETIRALFTPERRDDWSYLDGPFHGTHLVQKARHAVATWSRRRREAEANAELARSHAATADALDELRGANDRLRIEMVERARLENERRLANKLEGIGQLAAGIAHEINTPAQYILSNAEMLEFTLAEWLPTLELALRSADPVSSAPEKLAELPALGADLDEAVRSILIGAKSIARIVGAMREFSRSDAPEMRPADLNRAINATLEVVRHEYRQVADIDLALGDLPQVNCHVGEIQQVLANLIVNAAHAIDRREPKTHGCIKIHSRHDRARGRIEISIADNGIGIPAEIRDRVFDPVFTTKPVGRGTGQGLAIAHNVVARHAGDLTFESTMGVGTRFIVSLPVRGPGRDVP
ncbi:MAG TPA: hybrid sensor histidine kinase/response regulator [Kofleriaceae bacterium]